MKIHMYLENGCTSFYPRNIFVITEDIAKGKCMQGANLVWTKRFCVVQGCL